MNAEMKKGSTVPETAPAVAATPTQGPTPAPGRRDPAPADNPASAAIPLDPDSRSPFRLYLTGIRATFSISFRRLFRSKFLTANLVLAALPVCIAILIAIAVASHGNHHPIGETRKVFQGILRLAYLQFIVFFIGNMFGFAVMRQEIDDRTLHYLLLQPVRRWVLVAGKLAAYLALASGVCLLSLWLTYLILMVPAYGVSATMADLFRDGRFLGLVKESGVLIMALLAYGSIAMLMGSIFKSGAYAVLLMAWEAGLPYLPSTLKLWTVMHYLQSLLPERLTEQRRLFEMLGEPASVPLCFLVIGGVSLFFILICAFLFHIRECSYPEV